VNNLRGRPFALLGVNVVRHAAGKLKEVMDKEKLTWRSFADQGAISRAWNLAATPTLYLIDHVGVIRCKWVGSPGEKVIDAAVERLVREAEGNSPNKR
jgi:hypothetical protein